MTTRNWLNISQQISILCVISFTMTPVMVGEDFDLSVSSLVSLNGMIAAVLWQQEVSLLGALVITLLMSARKVCLMGFSLPMQDCRLL